MSNALLSFAATTTAQSVAALAAESPGIPDNAIIAIGAAICVGIAILASLRPRTFSLASAPPRPNRMGPAYPVVILLSWIIINAAVGYAAAYYLGVISTLSTLEPNEPAMLKISLLSAAPAAFAMLMASLFVGASTFAGGLRGMGLSLRHWFGDILRGVAGYAIVVPVCLGLLEVMTRLLSPWPELTRSHVILQGLRLGAEWKVLGVATAAVLAPLAEELYFRGLVQSLMRSVIGRPWISVVVSSVFFAAMHLSAANTVPSIFVLSLVLGFLYERTGRLTPCIVLHTLFNSVSLVLQMVME